MSFPHVPPSFGRFPLMDRGLFLRARLLLLRPRAAGRSGRWRGGRGGRGARRALRAGVRDVGRRRGGRGGGVGLGPS